MMRVISRWVAMVVLVVVPGWNAAAADPEPPAGDATEGAAPGEQRGSHGGSEPVPTWDGDAPEADAAPAPDTAPPPPPPAGATTEADLGCRASPWCHVQGRCSAAAGQCVSRSDGECQASVWCRDFGLCRAGRDGTCEARTDGDCERSAGCRHQGLCEARHRRCGPMRPIAIAQDEEEPEGPYVPKEGRSSNRNIPLMVSGIVLTAGGGVGVLWMITELFQAWGAGATGGEVGDEQEARLIGSIALTVGGLGIGLPMLIYGARSRPARSAGGAAPLLLVGPGAATVQWRF